MPRDSTDAPLKGSTLPIAKTVPSWVRMTATASPRTSAATPPSSGIESTAHTSTQVGTQGDDTAVMTVLRPG